MWRVSASRRQVYFCNMASKNLVSYSALNWNVWSTTDVKLEYRQALRCKLSYKLMWALGPWSDCKDQPSSFNRTQSRVIFGLLSGYNTLRRHSLNGVTNSPLYMRCGTEDESSVHILCECEALASLRHSYLGSFFLEDPQDIKSLSLGVIWNFIKGTWLTWTGISLWGTKGPLLRPRCFGTVRARTQPLINQSVWGRSHKLQALYFMARTLQNIRQYCFWENYYFRIELKAMFVSEPKSKSHVKFNAGLQNHIQWKLVQ